MRYLAAFGRFWYDFLIGDRPVLFVGPVIGLAIAAILVRAGWQTVAALLLFAVVIASAGWSLAAESAEARLRSIR
jgi:hypothetical protein